MNAIKVTVRDKIATGDGSPIICFNKDYKVHFEFDDEWRDLNNKTMRVETDQGYEDVVFSGTEASLPMVYRTKDVKIGVFAGNLHTTSKAVFDGIYSILDGYGFPLPPTDDVYAQIMSALNGKQDKPDSLPTYDASKTYVLCIIPVDGEWVPMWREESAEPENPYSPVVGIGRVGYMIIK